MTPRNLVVTQNITLDGVIDAAGDWFGVSVADDAEAEAEFAEVQREHRDSADAVLLGRVTYESFAGFWPLQTEDRTGVSDYLDRTQKYVVSARMPAPSWQSSTVLRGPVTEEVAALKQQPEVSIEVPGSITLVHALPPIGLVDEYRLFAFRSGIALLRYPTGSSAS